MLALLAEDVADIPHDILERAIDRHVATSPYMAKAADIRKIAQALVQPSTSLEAYAEGLNQQSFSKANGWHWFVNTATDGRKFVDRKDATWAR